MIEQAEVITSNSSDDEVEHCDLCGGTEKIVGTDFAYPTGYLCIDCPVEVIAAA